MIMNNVASLNNLALHQKNKREKCEHKGEAIFDIPSHLFLKFLVVFVFTTFLGKDAPCNNIMPENFA